MKFSNQFTPSRWAVMGLMLGLGASLLQAASNVAPPNILWHHRATGSTRVWMMSGTNVSSQVNLPATADDVTWKPVGTGDFNRDGSPDIVWQNETTGQNAVWYMNGTIMFAGGLIQSAGDLSWKIVGVADFNGDGKPDLLWQNLELGLNAVWLMDNTSPSSFHLITSAGDPNWKITATGDLNRDGKVDILLRNQSTGQNAVWYMNGLDLTAGDLLKMTNGSEASERDQDWQIVGTADFNADGRLDLLWRHATLGVNVCWFLQGGVVISSGYLGRHEFDTDWRISSQDTAVSDWRLRTADFTYLRAAASLSPVRVGLTFKLRSNGGFGITVQRRLVGHTPWTTLTTGLQGTAYTDSTVAAGQTYEYRVYREGFNGVQFSAAEHVSVALNTPALENRGKVVLLVDQTVASALSTSLAQLQQDLIGDGWAVVRHDVPRHVDDYSSATSFRINASNTTNVIKPLIRSAVTSDPNTKVVLIVGHVSIPYSGTFNPDGHNCGPPPFGPDHRGAWPADMYYGDLAGQWTDTSANLINCHFPEPNNAPGDGKFDQDGIPSPFVLKLAVGRIDFARLPVFTSSPPPGSTAKSEVTLLQQYLNKSHLYRLKQLNWQQNNPQQTMVYGHFHDARDNQIFENAQHAALAVSENLAHQVVGDFCLQRTRTSVWGLISGAGALDRVNQNIPVLEHTAAELTNPANEPKVAFSMALCSFMGDWNLGSNNYLRSLLATPNYGLASMWTRFALWRIDAMGVGEHLGAAMVRMVNDPKNVFYDQSRDLTILGDPTLRLHILAPPFNLSATTRGGRAQLTWSAGEPGAEYYVYRGPSLAGPFTRISASSVAGTSFTDNSPHPSQRVYMVRAIKSTVTGNGSYQNISQGAFATSR